jgi:hypothetical protein
MGYSPRRLDSCFVGVQKGATVLASLQVRFEGVGTSAFGCQYTSPRLRQRLAIDSANTHDRL